MSCFACLSFGGSFYPYLTTMRVSFVKCFVTCGASDSVVLTHSAIGIRIEPPSGNMLLSVRSQTFQVLAWLRVWAVQHDFDSDLTFCLIIQLIGCSFNCGISSIRCQNIKVFTGSGAHGQDNLNFFLVYIFRNTFRNIFNGSHYSTRVHTKRNEHKRS